MTLTEQVKSKSQSIFFVFVLILAPMWMLFLINNVVAGGVLSQFGGVYPRTFSFLGMSGIFTSWMFHADWNHLIGNTQVILSLLLFISVFEKEPFKVIGGLIVASGIFTWLFGASGTMHIGASGLIFAMFGYVFASIVFARRWLYIIALFVMGADYLYCMKAGLIPQAGVSFAGHFGGLVGGILVAYLIGKMSKKEQI